MAHQRVVDVLSRATWEALPMERVDLVNGIRVVLDPIVKEGVGGFGSKNHQIFPFRAVPKSSILGQQHTTMPPAEWCHIRDPLSQ